MTRQQTQPGHAVFARYAFPPNELGYCGPSGIAAVPDGDAVDLASYARKFDGAWPYLDTLAETTGRSDPLDEQIVRSYWLGGPLLAEVDGRVLHTALSDAFRGQVTGLLRDVAPEDSLAHHSFHVFVVYPWVRFLDRDPSTPLKILQDCRIRWGIVDAVDDDHAVVVSRPLMFHSGALGLAEAVPERVRWRRDGASLASAPMPGQTVSAHWGWICGTLTAAEAADLEVATRATLTLVNDARLRRKHATQVRDPGHLTVQTVVRGAASDHEGES